MFDYTFAAGQWLLWEDRRTVTGATAPSTALPRPGTVDPSEVIVTEGARAHRYYCTLSLSQLQL